MAGRSCIRACYVARGRRPASLPPCCAPLPAAPLTGKLSLTPAQALDEGLQEVPTELVGLISDLVQLSERADAAVATGYLRLLSDLLGQPGSDQIADQFSFELFPAVARLLRAVGAGTEGARLAAHCAAEMGQLCSAREVALLVVEILEQAAVEAAAGRSARKRRVVAKSLVALLPVLSIVNRRMAGRGGKQAELSRKYTSCLPVIIACFRCVTVGETQDEADDEDDDEPEPEPASDDDAGAGESAAASEAMIHAGTLSAVVAFVENGIGTSGAQQEAEEEAHLVRYLLLRFTLSVLGAQGESTCDFAASPVALVILSAAHQCGFSIADLLTDFTNRNLDASESSGGVRERAMSRLGGQLGPDACGSDGAEDWASEGWEGAWRGMIAYTCYAMPSPADEAAGADSDAVTTLLLSGSGRFWLEAPLLVYALRQAAVGADRPWVLRALQRLGLAVSVLHGCEATLDVPESSERSRLLLGIGQALLQFMSQSPDDSIRNQAGGMFHGVLSRCTPPTRFWLLRLLLATEPRHCWSAPPPPAAASFILHAIKDEAAAALASQVRSGAGGSDLNPFGGGELLEILTICKAASVTGGLGELYHQPAPTSSTEETLVGKAADMTSSRLVEQADVLLSCLNLLRFVLMRDKPTGDAPAGRTGVWEISWQVGLRAEMTQPLQLRLGSLQAALGRLGDEHGQEQAAWAQTRVGMVQMVTDAIDEMLIDDESTATEATKLREDRGAKLAIA